MTNYAKRELSTLENPSAEAEWLVALTLNKRRSDAMLSDEISKRDENKIIKNVARRKRGEPLAYIVGDAEFFGLRLFVNRHVLIPRPETEELVECALSFIQKGQSVLDIGTGSGAIAIAIKKFTGAAVTAVDKSRSALKLAKKNADFHNACIEFLESDLFEAVKNRKFDIIISNPPYISPSDYEKLEKTVKDFEPKLALFAKKNGLEFYEKIIMNAKEHLNENGKIFFEVGQGEASEVKKLLEKDFRDIKIKKDLEGIDRIVYATKSGEKYV